MADYFWPQQLVPSASSWSLVANTAAFTSPLSGTTRTLARGGDRWRCSFTFDNLTSDKRAILQAFLTQLRGQANRVYVVDHAYRQRGLFPAANLLPNFASATPWAAQYATLAVADGVGRIKATAHSGGQVSSINRAVALAVANPYALRAFFVRSSTGTASMGPSFYDGSTSVSSYSTSAGLKTASGTAATASGAAYAVIDSTSTSTVAGDFADVSYVSLSRCMNVSGGSQTGSVLNVQSPVVYDGILLAGDRIEVNGEYNMVADTVDSDGGSNTKIRLVRPLRTSPTNGAPVIIHDPACRMMLADSTVSWSNVPGRFSSFTVELVEDLL